MRADATITVTLTLAQMDALLDLSERGEDDLRYLLKENPGDYTKADRKGIRRRLRLAAEAAQALRDRTVLLSIGNAYSDGHESIVFEVAPAPGDDLVTWWETEVFPLTGDGHGEGRNLSASYCAAITRAADPALVGQSMSWEG